MIPLADTSMGAERAGRIPKLLTSRRNWTGDGPAARWKAIADEVSRCQRRFEAAPAWVSAHTGSRPDGELGTLFITLEFSNGGLAQIELHGDPRPAELRVHARHQGASESGPTARLEATLAAVEQALTSRGSRVAVGIG